MGYPDVPREDVELADIKHEIERLGIRLVRKSEWWLTRWIAVLLKPLPMKSAFMGFWTTIGRTITYPDHVEDPFDPSYRGTFLHEIEHVKQWDVWWVIQPITYVLGVPLPVLFAYFRWLWERGPYLIQINRGEFTPKQAADMLWDNYGWPWPWWWMERWFEKHKRPPQVALN